MGIAKITRNYQVTLPRDVREVKDLKEGDKVIFTIEDNKVNLVKVDNDVIKAAAGIWSKTRESGLVYERKMRAGWRRRLKRERHDSD